MSEKVISRKLAVLYGIILVLTQLLVTQWTVEAAGNRDVIDYVSFAGTLTSLLLAVLAIVYSYYTTTSQKSDAERIASQIGSLQSVITTINSSESRLSDELSRLSEIRIKLDDVGKSVNEGGELTAEIKRGLDRLQKEQQVAREAAKAAVLVDAREEARRDTADESDADCSLPFAVRLAETATEEQCLFFYCAWETIKDSSLSIRDVLNKHVQPFLTKENETGFILDSAYGEILGYVMVFMDLGLDSHKDVQKGFLAGLAENMSSIDESSDVGLKAYRQDLLIPYLKGKALELRRIADHLD